MTMMAFFHLLAASATGASGQAAASLDPAAVLVPVPRSIVLGKGAAPVSVNVSEALDELRSDLGDEGYVLQCLPDGFKITAHRRPGLFYARQTLGQLRTWGRIPCCTIEDKPAMKMRGVMFDMARLKEKHEYYYHVIDQLAKWKINTVFMHLTDHNGCAIQIKCYPELATKYAFTHSEMKKLIRYASERHIELIPEIESWGHARWITSVPALSNLAESPDKPGTLCTSNPRTWEVLGNIYREIAGLFPSKYIHAGCDEASFGFCEKCRAEIKADGEDALVGKHLRRVCELVKAAGKIPMIWGDVLLHRRGSVDQVPRETIICHWDYKADLSAEPVKFLKAKGFEVVGCPAIVWGSREILPMADTWDNVSNFARIVLDNRCLGMETTVWVPQRYIADTLYPALAHACEMSWSGPLRSRSEFVAAFARSFLGADPTPDVTEALIRVHDLSIKAYAKIADVGTYARDAFESGKTDSPPMPDVAKAAVSISDCLRRFRPKIKNHLEEYDSLILAADIRAYVEERAGAIEQLAGCLKQAKLLADEGKRSEAASVLQRPIAEIERLAAVDKGLSQRLTAAWDRWRYPDDPKKTEGEDNLTAGFARSGAFLSRTAQRLRSAASLVGKGETFQPEAILGEGKTQ